MPRPRPGHWPQVATVSSPPQVYVDRDGAGRVAGQARGMEIADFDGPFTYQHARSAGLSRRAVIDALDARAIRRLLRNVYVRSDCPDDPLLRARAAALVVCEHSVLCDRTAAWIHGVDTRRYAEIDVPPPVESYVLRGHHPTDRPEVAGGTRDLLPQDWGEVNGVRVTTPVRTAMDLGCKLPRRRALAAMDALMRETGFTD